MIERVINTSKTLFAKKKPDAEPEQLELLEELDEAEERLQEE